jgi:pilus assembly protein Flp/PilA
MKTRAYRARLRGAGRTVRTIEFHCWNGSNWRCDQSRQGRPWPLPINQAFTNSRYGWTGYGFSLQATLASRVLGNEQKATMKKILQQFIADESGATAIEYGLIAAGISLAIISIVNGLGTRLNTKFTAINNSLH